MAEPNWTKAWLAKARITDDPEGDLISDMRRDPNIPRLFHNRTEMRDYIKARGACREAVTAVTKVWIRYRRFIDHHPFLPPAALAGPRDARDAQ
jgi:hypothetical protein